MRPKGCSGLRIQTMKRASAVRYKYQAALDGRRGKNVLLQGIRPRYGFVRDTTGSGCIDAFEPGFVLAPPEVAAPSDINAAVMDNGHAIKITHAFAAGVVVIVDD